MYIFSQIADMFWWIISSFSVSIGGVTFSLIGSIVFAGVIVIGFIILDELFG